MEKLSALPPGGKFLFLYYGCEKLAKGIVGIKAEWGADEAYIQNLNRTDPKAAASAIQLPVKHSESDLILFDQGNKKPPPASC